MQRRNFIRPKHVVHRIWNKTVVADNGCWLWMGSQDGRGYGHIRVSTVGKPEKVHRIAAYFFLDYSFSDLQVNHKCPNKHCWNPEHLYIGTQQENVWDMMIAGKCHNQYK